MSVQAMTWVIEESKASGNALVVALMIANHAHADGTGAHPFIATLARESRCSERTVQRSIDELVELGELRIDRNDGPGGANVLTLLMGGDKLTPRQIDGGDTHDTPGVTNTTFPLAPSPHTPLPPTPEVVEPSLEPSERETREVPEFIQVLRTVPGWNGDDDALVKWVEGKGVSHDFGLAKALALKDWWGDGSRKELRGRVPRATFQNWVNRDKGLIGGTYGTRNDRAMGSSAGTRIDELSPLDIAEEQRRIDAGEYDPDRPLPWERNAS